MRMVGLLSAHAVAIRGGGAGLCGLARPHGTGAVAGQVLRALRDYVYASVVLHSTAGFCAVPSLAGADTLTGVALMTGPSAFTFLEMQRFRQGRSPDAGPAAPGCAPRACRPTTARAP